jgi:hypothetical protein
MGGAKWTSFAMLSATELERRVVRSRQLVARQREFAAKLGEDFPVAVKLLKEFERSLALLEDSYRWREVLTNTVGKAVSGSNALLVASFFLIVLHRLSRTIKIECATSRVSWKSCATADTSVNWRMRLCTDDWRLEAMYR